MYLTILRIKGAAVVPRSSVLVPASGLVLGSLKRDGVMLLDSGAFVAPEHARLRYHKGYCYLKPSDPRSACVLNGEMMAYSESVQLIDGDILEVGFVALAVSEAPLDKAISAVESTVSKPSSESEVTAGAFTTMEKQFPGSTQVDLDGLLNQLNLNHREDQSTIREDRGQAILRDLLKAAADPVPAGSANPPPPPVKAGKPLIRPAGRGLSLSEAVEGPLSIDEVLGRLGPAADITALIDEPKLTDPLILLNKRRQKSRPALSGDSVIYQDQRRLNIDSAIKEINHEEEGHG